MFEERRRGEQPFVPAKAHGNTRKSIERELAALRFRAIDHGLGERIKLPEWGLSLAAMAWIDGASFEALEPLCEATPGDVVRHFRMASQLARQVRRAIDPSWDLHERLRELMDAMNRDVVDARRQLELG